MRNKYYQLDSYIKNNKIELKTFLNLSIDLSHAVHLLHKNGEVYGALSPSTILVNDSLDINLYEIYKAHDSKLYEESKKLLKKYRFEESIKLIESCFV